MSAAEQWLDELTEVAETDDGTVVFASVSLDLDIDSVITVRRRHASTDRAQGLALDAAWPGLRSRR